VTSVSHAPRSTRALLLMFASLAVYLLADLGSKEWALDSLSRERRSPPAAVCQADEQGYTRYQRVPTEPRVWIDGVLVAHYAENCGAAFGMLDEAPRWLRVSVFMGAGIIAIAALLWMFVRGHGGALFAAAVPLVASGALGNMVDRLRLGYVVDFIHFHIRDSFEWPTFNVADSTITIGVALLLLDGLRRPAPSAVPSTAAETEKSERADARST
jgi:lipoprotein signal peptidase